MNGTRLTRWVRLLPLVPIVVVAMLPLIGTSLHESLRNGLFDQYQRWYPREYVDAPVRIVDIDDASLAHLGQWPWPRTRMAELVEHLRTNGAAVIAFDIMFAEPDRTSPPVVANLLQLRDGLREALAAMPDHDMTLADSLRRTDAVLGFALRDGVNATGTRMPRNKAAFVHLGKPQNGRLYTFGGAVAALPGLEAAASGNGALTFVPDTDGIVRRIPLVLRAAGGIVPALSSETLRVMLQSSAITLRSAGHANGFAGERDNDGLAEIRIGRIAIPTTANGELWMHYTRPHPERSIPAWRILAGAMPEGEVSGKVVIIGSSAQGLMDLRFSPFGLMPGVEVHAQALEQMLGGHFLQRPSWVPGGELALLVVLGLLMGVITLRTEALVAAFACALLLAVLAAGGWTAFRYHGLLLNPVWPALGIVLVFVVCGVARHLSSERERRWIRNAFSRYVSPNRVAYLVDHPETMALGGRRQECSFIFTDLAGFTGLMEGMDPAEAVALMNEYLDGLIGVAFRHEGTLDRIVGDAVVIMFSAPLPQADHRARALACALEMDAFASRYSGSLREKGIPFGETRIGVHAGEVVVGNFGGKHFFDYRALGDPINTAARLESVNKHLGTRVCVSDAIIFGSVGARVRPVGHLVLKGKSKSLGVFEPDTDEAGRAPLEDYLAAYALLVANDARSWSVFERLADSFPDDPLVRLHLSRLRAGGSGDLIVMDEK